MADDPDQAWLREVVHAEIKAVYDKHDVSGFAIVCSKRSASWCMAFASWCGLQPDPTYGLRLRLKSATQDDRDNADATLGFLSSVAEQCLDKAKFFGRFFNQTVATLERQGAVVEHQRPTAADGVNPLTDAPFELVNASDIDDIIAGRVKPKR